MHQDVFGIVIPDYSGAVKAAAARGTLALLGNASIAEVRTERHRGTVASDRPCIKLRQQTTTMGGMERSPVCRLPPKVRF
jgi:hypothetical protein